MHHDDRYSGEGVQLSSYDTSANGVTINHGIQLSANVFIDLGFSSTSYHFQNLLAANGSVKGGTGIGKVGNTGWSSGPHLHYQMESRYSTNFLATLYGLNIDTNGGRFWMDPEVLWKKFKN